jgi:hypothetical protein
MGDICDVTDRWAKIFIIFFNQEEEQKYIPPSKRAILPTPSIPQITLPKSEPAMPIQSARPEAPPYPEHNKDTQKGKQHQPQHSTNHHKLSFPKYNGNEEPSQWLYKYNKFFIAQNTKEEEQMHLAAFHLQRDALT